MDSIKRIRIKYRITNAIIIITFIILSVLIIYFDTKPIINIHKVEEVCRLKNTVIYVISEDSVCRYFYIRDNKYIIWLDKKELRNKTNIVLISVDSIK